MIETEDQRRWWFATHPEYSSSRRGTRNEGGVDPQEVDRYMDEALKSRNRTCRGSAEIRKTKFRDGVPEYRGTVSRTI